MRDPLMGTDLTCYEKDAVRKWVLEKSMSPTTRLPMQMHCLTPDHTMRRIVTALEDNNI